ncbi:MAG: hypothetical protein NTZ73_04040 [Candidatus Diapherotrites archaeon]|nr:hypothetical protein [Candidatus Diapherotrites archaeon]
MAVDRKGRKEIKSAKKAAVKARKKTAEQGKEINKLKVEIEKLKKKKKMPSKHVSEYNFFIKRQILAGATFAKAVKEWNKYKALLNKTKRRPSAYNQFIGSQMRLGKTFKQAVALWRLAKAGKLGRKGKTRTVTKTVVKVRRIKSKPRVITKLRYRTRNIKSKPRVITKLRYRTRKIIIKPKRRRVKRVVKIVRGVRRVHKVRPAKIRRTTTISTSSEAVTPAQIRSIMQSVISSSRTVSRDEVENLLGESEEEIAFKIIQTYFKEVARLGFKKQLTLDEIVNAYLYALARVRRQDIEMTAIADAVKKSRMRR